MQASVDDKVVSPAQYIEGPVMVELRATLISDRFRAIYLSSPGDACFFDAGPICPLSAQIIRVLETLYPNPSILRTRLDLP
jgi:hypothetical protein